MIQYTCTKKDREEPKRRCIIFQIKDKKIQIRPICGVPAGSPKEAERERTAFYMLDLKTPKRPSSKNRIALDVPLMSTVESVEWAPGFVKGTAFLIKYALTDSAGTITEYEEIFFSSASNTRTDKFYRYLEQNGIYDLADFVGCTEKLTFLKTAKKDRTYTNISNREFIAAPSSKTHNVGTKV